MSGKSFLVIVKSDTAPNGSKAAFVECCDLCGRESLAEHREGW